MTNPGALETLRQLRLVVSAVQSRALCTSFEALHLYLENVTFDLQSIQIKSCKSNNNKGPPTYSSSLVLANEFNCTGARSAVHHVSKKNGGKRAL